MPHQPMSRVLSLKASEDALEKLLARNPDHLDQKNFAERLHRLLHQAHERKISQKEVVAVLSEANKAIGLRVATSFVESLVANAFATISSSGEATGEGVANVPETNGNESAASDPHPAKSDASHGAVPDTQDQSATPVVTPVPPFNGGKPGEAASPSAVEGQDRSSTDVSDSKNHLQTGGRPLLVPAKPVSAEHTAVEEEQSLESVELDEAAERFGAIGRHTDGKMIFRTRKDRDEFEYVTGEHGRVLGEIQS